MSGSESRAGMVRSAAGLISARGVSATSFADVLADSGAPRGSIYHHFPQGKRQLAEDAIRWTSARVLAFQRAGTATTPGEVLDRFVALWRDVVLGSHGATGCVVAGTAVDSEPDPNGLIGVVREVFREWIALLAEQFTRTGVDADRAGPIATTVLAALEGALLLCRAEADVGPLEAVATQLHRLLEPTN